MNDGTVVDLLDLDPLVVTVLFCPWAFPFFSKGLDDLFLPELHAVGYEVGKTVNAMPVMVDGDVEGLVGVFAFHILSVSRAWKASTDYKSHRRFYSRNRSTKLLFIKSIPGRHDTQS